MSTFDLPVMGKEGFHRGLCEGVLLGVKAMAGFPSLDTIEHTAGLSHHSVNVFNSDSPYVFQ